MDAGSSLPPNGSAVDRSTLPGTTVLVPSPLPTGPDADRRLPMCENCSSKPTTIGTRMMPKLLRACSRTMQILWIVRPSLQWTGQYRKTHRGCSSTSVQWHHVAHEHSYQYPAGPDIVVLEVQWQLLGEGRDDKTITITGLRVYPQQCTVVGQRRSRHGHQAVASRSAAMRKPRKRSYTREFLTTIAAMGRDSGMKLWSRL